MNLKDLSSREAYNLIVTAEDTAWESNKYEIEKSRFLEYTTTDIRAKYTLSEERSLKDIIELPCLFLYELGIKNVGYIGYITNIKIRSKKIGFKFEKIDTISIDTVKELAFDLDIDLDSKGITELHRTHWAVKKVNLIRELQENGIITTPALSKPIVFISYSWDSMKTRTKVKSLVEKLESDGVDVMYDNNSLKLGHDITFFMEKLSNDPNIKKVLVVCDESYKQKADSRKNGVGTETEIIISEVYSNPLQSKIIPVFFEKNENGEMITPSFLKTRFGVDFTSGIEKNNYFRLLQDIFS